MKRQGEQVVEEDSCVETVVGHRVGISLLFYDTETENTPETPWVWMVLNPSTGDTRSGSGWARFRPVSQGHSEWVRLGQVRTRLAETSRVSMLKLG